MASINIHDDGKGEPRSIRASAEIDPGCTPGTITVRVWAGSEEEALLDLTDQLLQLTDEVEDGAKSALTEIALQIDK